MDTDKPPCLAYFRALVWSSFRTLCSAGILDTYSGKQTADLASRQWQPSGAIRKGGNPLFHHGKLLTPTPLLATTGSGRGGDL